MSTPDLGLRLRSRLGPEPSEDLSNAFDEVQNDMLTIITDRFEGRLVAVGAELRAEIVRGQSEVRQDMAQMESRLRIAFAEGLADTRVDVLRWAFLFWVSQVAAMFGMLAFMLRSR
jgi:hypothetical protein